MFRKSSCDFPIDFCFSIYLQHLLGLLEQSPTAVVNLQLLPERRVFPAVSQQQPVEVSANVETFLAVGWSLHWGPIVLGDVENEAGDCYRTPGLAGISELECYDVAAFLMAIHASMVHFNI